MQLNVFRKGFNTSQDGPGNRLVYHLQGCNMRCAWCSNPEGMARKGTLLVDAEGLRESACPHGAIIGKTIDRTRCASCETRECLTINRNQSIRWSSTPCDVEALVVEARRSVPLYFDGGGVTLSGGEVTVQFAAFFRPLDTARARFEFLSYHEYGKDKWAQCGLPYRMERMKSAFVGNETVAQFQSVFAAAGLHVIHT